MADKARVEASKTQDEFSAVAASRKTPDETTATGQPLTHYHSMFYTILSWESPRVSAITYAAIITFIFVTRYVPILSLTLKGTYIVLGTIAAAEMAGKFIFDNGLASQMRPKKYYTIPRESLERSLEDIEQLINFFVIEIQRIVFAENIYKTAGAFATALISYFLVKFVPKWGIALIGTTAIYFIPFIYIQNREFIDGHLNNAGNLVNQQATQIRDIASEHAGRASEAARSTANTYTAKAQEMMGQTKKNAASSDAPNPANLNPMKDEPERDLKREDFPTAPRTSVPNTEGIMETSVQADGQPRAVPQ